MKQHNQLPPLQTHAMLEENPSSRITVDVISWSDDLEFSLQGHAGLVRRRTPTALPRH
jgi:hypothetical protein